MSTRTYSCFVDAHGEPCGRRDAVARRWTAMEVVHPDGTESTVDEWEVPVDGLHDPDPETAKLDAGDAAYHERKENP